MPETEQRNQDWLNRWREGRIGFHRSQVNPLLEKYFSRLKGEAPAQGDQVVLVPLCGKSKDMLYLRGNGLNVLGVELSDQALRDFFQENDLPFTAGATFRGEGYELIAGDFFALDAKDYGSVKYIYDRAALIAMPPTEHARYAEQLMQFAAPDARMLLITLEYDQTSMNGPPFSVGPNRVRELFEPRFRVEQLEGADVLAGHPKFLEHGVSALKEHCFLLS